MGEHHHLEKNNLNNEECQQENHHHIEKCDLEHFECEHCHGAIGKDILKEKNNLNTNQY